MILCGVPPYGGRPRRRRREQEGSCPAELVQKLASAANRCGANLRESSKRKTPPGPGGLGGCRGAAAGAVLSSPETSPGFGQEVAVLVGERRVPHPIVAEVRPGRDEDAASRRRQLELLLHARRDMRHAETPRPSKAQQRICEILKLVHHRCCNSSACRVPSQDDVRSRHGLKQVPVHRYGILQLC